MKGSSSRMKNKVGAQKGAFIKMKQENIYVYQWLCWLCYVPIIGTSQIKQLSTVHYLLFFRVGQIWDAITKNRVDLLRVLGQVIRC